MPLYPYPDNLNLKAQSVEIPGSKVEGYSGIYKNGFFDESLLTAPGQPQTLFEVFEQSTARHPDMDMFLRRETLPGSTLQNPIFGTKLISTTYAEFQTRRTNIGSALLGLERAGRLRSPKADPNTASPPEIVHPGIPSFGNDNRLKNGARRGWAAGVWSKNREEWQVVDFACHAYGLVGVSLYETLGPDVAEYITNHCPLPIVFASANHIASLLKIAPRCPTLRIVVCMDPLPASEREVLSQWASTVDVELLDMLELEKWGAQEGVRCDPGPVKGVPGEFELDRDRIVTLSYTSGTTGNPKAVVLTNKNLAITCISNALGIDFQLDDGWRFLSYLPLSHIYERFMQLLVIYGDGTIGLTTGDTLKLLEDAQIIKPHFMPGVPRIYNRLHAAIKAQMNAPGLKGALLTRAVNTKIANWRATGEVKHAVYDALVFRKIRALLGGEIRSMTSGAAPLLPDVHELLKVCLSCDFIQGFGMTETVGSCTKGIAHDVDAVGTCGFIQPCNEARLMDVPEMGYTSNDKPNPRGELCLRGYNITPGYLHDPENTGKTIDSEGWMHTGDVAEFDSDGRMKIIDRIKNVVKLSQGEYVALEKLEGYYALYPLFAQLLVHGDSTRSSLCAIGVCDPVQASRLVQVFLGRAIKETDFVALEEAVKEPKFKQAVLKELAKISKKHKLNGFENIKGVHLTLSPFPEEILTPTFKVKRNVAAKKYKPEIDAIYVDTEKNPSL